jgi:hypothetical protein
MSNISNGMHLLVETPDSLVCLYREDLMVGFCIKHCGKWDSFCPTTVGQFMWERVVWQVGLKQALEAQGFFGSIPAGMK